MTALVSGCAAAGGAGNAAAVAPAPAQGPADVYIAAAPAAPAPPSLPQFLGLDLVAGCAAKTKTEIHNTVHRLFPILSTALPDAAGPPPPVPISSPENLDSPSPAVAAAAKIKQEEDQAQQKILALNYLATVGCGGCYPEVEQALLAAMDDCTEDVRFAAVKAVKEAAGQPCTYCKSGACCSPAVRKKLMQLAEQTGDDCCPGEPSARVRRLARIALTYCGGNGIVPLPLIEGPTPAAAWESLPPPAAAHNTSVPAQVPPAADPVAAAQPDSVAPAAAENIDELVAQWYQDVDPTLPMAKKKQLLQAFLAERFRQKSEQAVLQRAARQEFEFHQQVQDSLANLPNPKPAAGASVVAATHYPAGGSSIEPVSYATQVLTKSSRQKRSSTTLERLTWEEIRIDGTTQSRDQDVVMMTETWRLIHGRKPDPDIKVDRSRLKIRTRSNVRLADVADPQLSRLLTTLPVGQCSPVIVGRDRVFLIRVLNRQQTDDRRGPNEAADKVDQPDGKRRPLDLTKRGSKP